MSILMYPFKVGVKQQWTALKGSVINSIRGGGGGARIGACGPTPAYFCIDFSYNVSRSRCATNSSAQPPSKKFNKLTITQSDQSSVLSDIGI